MNAWNSNPEAQESTIVLCAGTTTDVTGITGITLVNKLKDIARANGISKFDVYDGNNNRVEASDIEDGDYSGNLRIERYNTAA